MSPDVLVARAMLVLPVLVCLFLIGALGFILLYGLRAMRSSPDHGGPPGWVWQSTIVILGLLWITLAGLDVGQFLVLFQESWGGLIGFAGVFFVPWLGARTVSKIVTPKGGQVEGMGDVTPPGNG